MTSLYAYEVYFILILVSRLAYDLSSDTHSYLCYGHLYCHFFRLFRRSVLPNDYIMQTIYLTFCEGRTYKLALGISTLLCRFH